MKAHIDRKKSGDYDLAPFLDTVLDNIDDEDDIIHQAITFLIGGFHTSGTYMTWFFYNLGLNLNSREGQERNKVNPVWPWIEKHGGHR